jgi:predicted nucleic acid-binding protein
MRVFMLPAVPEFSERVTNFQKNNPDKPCRNNAYLRSIQATATLHRYIRNRWYHDDEFKEVTRQFFDRIEAKEFLIYFSEVNETELVLAPQNVKDVKLKIPVECLRYIEIDDEAEQLAQTYISEKALGKASTNDAYHIALASVNRLDCLISWNFKHIVNFDKIKQFNSINLKLGYPLIDIRTPLEFLKYEN